MSQIASIAMGGLVGYQLYSTEEQKNKAKDLQKKQEDQANALIQENKNQEAISQATSKRDAARRRQKTLALGAQGQRDTILTGASGTGIGYEGPRKTLLGL